MVAGQLPQRSGHSKGHQEIGDWQEHRLLPVQPLIGSAVLACGPVAVLTGMVALVIVVAVFTGVDLAAKRFRTAVFDGLHRTAMAWRHLVPELGSVLRAVEAKALSDLSHDRSSMRRLMGAAAISCAVRVRCV